MNIPAILGAGFDVDVAQTIDQGGGKQPVADSLGAGECQPRRSQSDPTLTTSATDQASILGQINVPIYDGGTAASQTRQAKEVASQSRMVLEQVRNQIANRGRQRLGIQ